MRYGTIIAAVVVTFALLARSDAMAGPALPEQDSLPDDRDASLSARDFLTTGPVGAASKLLLRPNTTNSQEREDREIEEDMSRNWRKYQSED